jgi:prephenate dehydrogenase
VAFRTAVIGLGLVGSSIGLALKKKGADLEIVGHDKDHEAARRAHKNGCVDRTEWNLISACDGADLVVISTPLAGIKSTLTAIATELREGCVVTDTASLKVPVLSWARESLPATVHFVGGHPVVRTLKRGYGRVAPKGEAGAAEPSADLFAGALYCLTPATNAPPSALQRVSDLAEAIGARPYYMDAAEHDGLIAAVEQVPLLMGLALLDVARSSPAHREVARLSNADFDRVIEALAGDAQQLSEICTLNGNNVVRWLDSLLSRLTTLREAAAHQDSESLQEAFARALEARVAWARSEIESGETDYSDFSMTHMIMGDMFRPRPDQPQR